MASEAAAGTVVRAGAGVVEITWIANPFRGDRFEEAWRGPAEAVLRYGATGYAFFRSKEDLLKFTQLAFFERKLDFEKYWYSQEISEARTLASGLYQVPVLPEWHAVVAAGSWSELPLEA
jgi:hypothetical protein